jgi:hypothetical protein
MLEINWLVLVLAALIPLITGFIWYNPKIFGTAWMVESGMTEEKAKGANMAKVFIITFIMGFLIAFTIQFIVIHQYHYYSILAGEPGINDPGSPMGLQLAEFMKTYGDRFRSFKHGVLHGFLNALLFVTPIMTINSLFERKSFKYIAINAGYWIITIALIGGVVCAYA